MKAFSPSVLCKSGVPSGIIKLINFRTTNGEGIEK